VHRIFLFIFLSAAVLETNSFPQTFGIGGGLTTIQGPDSYTGHNIFGGVGFSNGYHFAAKLKIDIPLSPLTPAFSIGYHHLEGEDVGLNTSQFILSIGGGGDYKLITGQLSPYIHAEIEYNNFGYIKSPNGIPEFWASINGSRLGGAIGIGTEIIHYIDINIKYHFWNWIGKEPGEETISVLSCNIIILLNEF